MFLENIIIYDLIKTLLSFQKSGSLFCEFRSLKPAHILSSRRTAQPAAAEVETGARFCDSNVSNTE
jgi:hypothetical protein